MPYEIKYIELKTGYNDNGPAWIGYVKTSKTGTTIYFNDHAFQKWNCGNGNYIDVEKTDQVYWISGVKKNGQDRHWAGNGKIIIDRKVIPYYLQLIGQEQLDLSRFIIEDIDDAFPVERIEARLNKQ
ncbi:MAG: mannose-1-phosphate guanylyltransferase [Clostridiales bacterium]|nr:mannose-1-phosphate guanylyltransferase [Clostridiales bacterium]